MKPRKMLLSVGLLPTISETHEDATQAWHPGHHAHSLEDYVASIKELAQPAAFSTCTAFLVPRCQRPRLASFSRPKHPLPTALPPGTAKVCKPHLPVALDNITLTFATDAKRDCSGACLGSRDPLDWLFAQTDCEDLVLTGGSSASLCLL